MGNPEVLLHLDKVEVLYHRVVTGVQGVSLEVRQGQIVALLGVNGAGKTTTLRAISGFIGLDDAKVAEGTITFAGDRIENRQPHWITRRGIALVPERSKVFENLTVAENLEASMTRGLFSRRRAEMLTLVYEHFPQLAEARSRVSGYLSGGERQMLAIAGALMCMPKLLLVDELSLGLAPVVVGRLLRRLKKIRDDLGIAILLVEQNAPVALKVADYGYVIENGRVVLDGTAERLLAHQDVREFYLGQSQRGGHRSYRDVKQYRRSRRWYG